MGRLYDAYVEVGPRFTGFGDIKKQGDAAGKEYGKALAEAAAKAAQANVRKLGEALAKARSGEADAAGKVRIAEQKLAETRAQSNVKLSQITAAEEALAAAQRKSAAASGTAKSAAEALQKGREQAARAADDVGKNAGGRFTKALRGAMSKSDKDGAQVATRFGVGFNGAIGGIVSRSAGVFAAGFAAIQGAKVFASFINDARESAKVARVSAQVVKSTGGAAKITATQVGNLATAISNKTGADDEAIQSGENLLLTFTNVRNEVGKNNDIFNRASKAAVDMASAMNNGVVDANGLKAANIQLGKALNDPIKGVTALQKVGVSFTQKQKDQIKTLVESGHTLKAQKIILAEVNKEFGGAAAAAADPLTRLKTILGNVSESLGGLLLPVVNKVANFIGDTFVPGIYALGSAFQGEGITSDGFVGGMERIGVKARVVFDFFKAEVLPRLRDFAGFIKSEVIPRLSDFAGFITGKVIPTIAMLVTNMVTTLRPAAEQVFGFLQKVVAAVIPHLRDLAGWIGDKLVPKIVEMANWVTKTKDFFVPFVATILALVAGIKIVVLATRAWAAIQAAMNVVLAANPIGLVVIGIAALVAGIIWAFKNVGWFHDALVGAFQGIQKAAQTFAPLVKAAIDVVVAVFKLWWNYYAKPILTAFWQLLQFAWGKAQQFATVVSAAFNAIKEPARVAIKFVIDTFLNMVETVLKGAAKAFGWVPDLGDKLKNAAKAFGTFRDQVNAKLDGIKDQNVNVALTLQDKINAKQVNKAVQNNLTRRGISQFAVGGDVTGGTPGVDSVPALLMPGEHVLTKDDVKAMGGQQAVYSFRGQLHKFAAGGAVDFNVNSKVRNPDAADTAVGKANAYISRTASAIGSAVKAALTPFSLGSAPSGPPGAVQSFRGEKLNSRTIGMLLAAERILGRQFRIMQGSYSTRVAASGGTHSGGGAMDTDGPGGWDRAVSALRASGFASWHRTPAQGPWGHHIHSIAIGDSSASPSAKAQVKSFLRGGNGLGSGMAMGGAVLPVKKYDTGGMWPPGTFGYNGTGKPEVVRTAEQEARLGGPLQVRVFIGQRELTDIVRVEIDEKNRQAANSFNL